MTHINIKTLECGNIVVPINHITVHKFGDNYRLLVRDDTDWRDISEKTYRYLINLLDFG